MFVQRIQTNIEKYALMRSGTHVLLGISGGADSIAMLHALATLRKPLDITLSVAHLNHSIRPEAAEDAEFVAAQSRKLGCAFYLGHADVPALVAKSNASLEMAAREARYRFFAETAATCEADRVATAHTRDDQAETVLLKLCRGAGSSGLQGIARKTTITGLRVVRPLLECSRANVESFLQESNIPWREDATNADTQLKRNRMRHAVLPYLEKHFNPRIKEALAKTATILSDENAILAQLTETALHAAVTDNDALQIESLCTLDPAILRRVLQQWLLERGISPPHMHFDLISRAAALISSSSGTEEITVTADSSIRREYNLLRFASRTNSTQIVISETQLTIPGKTHLTDAGLCITTTYTTGFNRTPPGLIGTLPAEAEIRWNSASDQQLHIRSWQPGDRIEPLGMAGSCKLQDIFVNAKVPQNLRSRIPVFLCGDEVVWLPGYRIGRNRAVLDAKQCSLQLRVELA